MKTIIPIFGVNTGIIPTNAIKIGEAADTPATTLKDILLITVKASIDVGISGMTITITLDVHG